MGKSNRFFSPTVQVFLAINILLLLAYFVEILGDLLYRRQEFKLKSPLMWAKFTILINHGSSFHPLPRSLRAEPLFLARLIHCSLVLLNTTVGHERFQNSTLNLIAEEVGMFLIVVSSALIVATWFGFLLIFVLIFLLGW